MESKAKVVVIGGGAVGVVCFITLLKKVGQMLF
jgi:L-2-hydroxyglutarate oxidase LhgO